jgi:hypothetical protein
MKKLGISIVKCLILSILLCIKRVFIAFSYMIIMNFDHINPPPLVFYIPPLTSRSSLPLIPSPSTSLVVRFLLSWPWLFCPLFCFPLASINERKHAVLIFVGLLYFPKHGELPAVPFIFHKMTQFYSSYGWVKLLCVYVLHFLYLFMS